MLSAVSLGVLLAAAGCGGDDGSGDETGKGGSSTAGTKTTAGTGNEQGGEAGVTGGTSGTGGTSSGAGSPSSGGDDSTSPGAGGSPDDPGPGGGLGAADGITGTINGVVHTHTFNVYNVPQMSETVVIGADSAMYPPWDKWGLRFLPELGSQDCTGDTGTEDTFITYGSFTVFNDNGTTASGGSCTINVTSIAPKLEGTFIATIATSIGKVSVTAGQFRVPR